MSRVVAVTGATGFVGAHVVRCLQKMPCCRVVAAGRNAARLRDLGVDYVVHDLDIESPDCYERFGSPDVLIHLAWEGLPNYNELFHIEQNLVNSYRFLKAMVVGGLPTLAVSGTCYEYGLASGCLCEDLTPTPTTSYGTAKDALRRFLEHLRMTTPYSLRWGRFFFMYGEGQNQRALIPQLDLALDNRVKAFNMSGGEQLRDYLPVERVAELIVRVALQRSFDGIFNICSGNPVSVRRLVEQRIVARKGLIELNLGTFPYPEHEPMAYWGDPSRLNQALNAFQKEYDYE